MENRAEHNELAKNAYERVKALAHGLNAKEATRTACRLSKWANPAHVQWKDINNEVTKDMIVQVWPCSEREIKKGRWKIARCENDDIKANAERIFLEVYGHPLHNADAPLYYAKMLYMQFVIGRPVDFASRAVTVNTHDIREETVTFTREELALMLEGAGLELTAVKESMAAQLAEKEQEALRLTQMQTPAPTVQAMEQQLNALSQGMHNISEQLNPRRQGNHISHHLVHPEFVGVEDVATSSAPNQCPQCYKVFDGWSGNYNLPCGHYYHLICLVRLMQAQSTCAICNASIHKGLYTMFGMASEYKQVKPINSPPSVLRDLDV